MTTTKAKVRQDLINNGLSVPIGPYNYGGEELLEYRWIEAEDGIDELFEVLFKDQWLQADSIDFDFV